MHTQIHRRQEITLDQLHLLRGENKGHQEKGGGGGAGIFIDPISTKTTFQTVDWFTVLSGWLTTP